MYVLLIIYSAMSSAGWETTRLHQDFTSMKECQRAYADWKMALQTKFISGQCYYRPLRPINQ